VKIESFHEGDRGEPLAQVILSGIAHIIPVPRPADYFGVDLFAQLFSADNGSLRVTGTTIAVQIKSNTQDVVVSSPDGIQALHALAVPFFIGVVDRGKRTVALYSTLFRFAAYWMNPAAHLIFDLKADAPGLSSRENEIRIQCGAAIAIASQDEMDDPDPDRRARARDALRRVLDYWIRLEADAIAWKATGLPMSPCPPADYETNQYCGEIPSIILSGEHARLGPLLDAMEYAAFAFTHLSEAASRSEQYTAREARAITEMAHPVEEQIRRIRELRADIRLAASSPYFRD
jgi:hypothetical protein